MAVILTVGPRTIVVLLPVLLPELLALLVPIELRTRCCCCSAGCVMPRLPPGKQLMLLPLPPEAVGEVAGQL